MKIINSIIGILIILVGSLFMSVTVYDEEFTTIAYKVSGFLIFCVGIFYLKKLRSLGDSNGLFLYV